MTRPAKTLDSAEADSAESGPAEPAPVEPDSAEPSLAPRTRVRAAPTGPRTTDFAIADSGNPPQVRWCAERRTPSSVRTSRRRVKPDKGKRERDDPRAPP